MPDVMHTSKTIEVLVVVYIGGRASLWGGAAIAIPFVFAMEMVRSVFSDYPGLNLIFYGLFLIVIMIYYPGGVAQFYAFLTERFKASRLVRLAVGNRLDSP
jgi:branched-chain amino acid transport system permease protein